MRTSSILTIALLAPAALALAACSPSQSGSNSTTQSSSAAATSTTASADIDPLHPSTAEVAKFRALEVKLWDAWNKRLKPADAAKFYSKYPQNLYFDFSPLKFTGWAEYQKTAAKALGSMGGGHAETHINDDFTLIKGPAIAVVAFTFSVDFHTGNGAVNTMVGRETDVWVQQDDGSWLIAHQHMSIPST